jgi:integrase/recombinase XerD
MNQQTRKREPLILMEHPQQKTDKLKANGTYLVAFLDTVRTRKYIEDRYCIRLRITYKSVPHYYTIKGVMASKEEWAKMNSRCPSSLREKKDVVLGELLKANDILVEMPRFDAKKFKAKLRGELGDVNDVWGAIEAYIRNAEKKGCYSSAQSYTSARTNFQEYWGTGPLTFEQIDLEWLNGFKSWATGKGEKKPKRIKRESTVGVYTRNLKRLYNEAARKEKALKDINPFSQESEEPFRPPASGSFHRALSKEEISKLFNYKCESDFQTLCLDMFLFSYLCNGANFADVVRLQKKNIAGDSIIFVRQKTRKPITADLSEPMKALIERSGNSLEKPETFLFPVLDPFMDEGKRFARNKGFTKSANVHLKKIAADLGIDTGISTMWARHTHATMLKRSKKVSTAFIQEQLGHSTSAITERYLSSFEDEARKEASKILTDF